MVFGCVLSGAFFDIHEKIGFGYGKLNEIPG